MLPVYVQSFINDYLFLWHVIPYSNAFLEINSFLEIYAFLKTTSMAYKLFYKVPHLTSP